MKRKIIQIDQARCNGCGECIPNCPEGALQIVNGKACLVSDVFCDGLGACIKRCPQDAIRVIERKAESYDEEKVMANVIRCGTSAVAAHLQHLKDHNEDELYKRALDYLKSTEVVFDENISDGAPAWNTQSELRQWPVQLKLLNPQSEFFDNAHILVSADCVAHTYGAFHADFLKGKKLIVFCPKLDGAADEYVEKLAAIFASHNILSVTILRMEVPCCGGTAVITSRAIEKSGKPIPTRVITISLDGKIL